MKIKIKAHKMINKINNKYEKETESFNFHL